MALAGGGGGIRGFGTAATIDQCVIENNQSSFDGGGIWNVDGLISQCLIRGNTAVEGGGLADCGPDTVDGSSILNCIIANNSASNGGGLADCTAKIRNCTIVDNRAHRRRTAELLRLDRQLHRLGQRRRSVEFAQCQL